MNFQKDLKKQGRGLWEVPKPDQTQKGIDLNLKIEFSQLMSGPAKLPITKSMNVKIIFSFKSHWKKMNES